MNQPLTHEPSANPNHDAAKPESPQIAVKERVVLFMFVIVGGLFGIILLVDLILGFFR